MKREAVLGVDSSTQSTKVIAVDLDTGEQLAEARASHTGASIQDPLDWWNALIDATRSLGLEGIAVRGMAVAGQQHGLVTMDREGNPVRPAPLWNNLDAAEDAERLNAEADFASLVGSRLVAAFTIAKLSHFRRTDPDAFAATTAVGLPHDWLNFQLTGRLATDRGDASGTGWWSPIEGRLMPELLELAIGIEAAAALTVSPVLEPEAAVGRIGAESAMLLGLPAETIVAAGTGDNMGAALGIGLEPGDYVVSLGTSGTAYAISDRATTDELGEVAGFADATGRFLPLACVLNCTRVISQIADLLGLSIQQALDLAEHTDPGAGGVFLIPYFEGERTPNLPSATGSISGLRGTNLTPANLLRAAVDGVAANMAICLGALQRQGVEGSGIVLVGGGSAHRCWQQAIADVTGLPVSVRAGGEHVARGAAVQAAAVVREESVADQAKQWRPERVAEVKPRAGARDAFRLEERLQAIDAYRWS